ADRNGSYRGSGYTQECMDRSPMALSNQRHVANRPHDSSRRSLGLGATRIVRRAERLPSRQTEVEDFDPLVERNEDIVRLQIPMDDPLGMSGQDRPRWPLRFPRP